MPESEAQVLRSLGKEIRRRRVALGISQEELGALVSLHRTYIGGVERGERNVTLLSLYKIAQGLGTTPHELLQAAGL